MVEVNNKNVVVCGYPKSGTMWATRLVAQVLDCPVGGYWGNKHDPANISTVREGEDRESSWSCFLSHYLFDELTVEDYLPVHRIIYIVRDPRDIVVSGIFHFNFYHEPVSKLRTVNMLPGFLLRPLKFASRNIYTRPKKIRRMIDMLKYGDPYIYQCENSWDSHINSYLNRDVHFVRYEDLLEDGQGSLERILDYLGTRRTGPEITSAINAQSFERRKEEFISKKDYERAKHLRNGRIGDWINHLSPDDESDITDHFAEYMKKFNYAP